MTEAGLLIALAPDARALAPQATALPPLAVFHDLRWLYASQHSWLGFGLLLAAIVLGRSALNTVLIRLAWPKGAAAPSMRDLLRRTLAVTAFACLLLSPLVSLTFGVAILPFSWPFLAMIPALLMIALPLSHAGMVSDWWRVLPPLAAVGWLLAEFAVLSAAAALTGDLPTAAAVPVAGLAGLVNARAWYATTRALARPQRHARLRPGWLVLQLGWLALPLAGAMPPMAALEYTPKPASPPHAGTAHRIPAAPLALAVAIALLIALTRAVFVFSGPGTGPGAGTGVVPEAAYGPSAPGQAAHAVTIGGRRAHHPVLEILGFGSSCCARDSALARAMPGTQVELFSYRGLTRSGQPLPYEPADSNLPLPDLGDLISAQVWRLHDETGQPVDIVAESEGTLGVDAMLARHPAAPVGSVVLLSPIVAPGQARYGNTAGSGMVTGGELNAVVWFIGGLSPFGTSGAERLIDSVNSVGARFASEAAEDPPVRVMELVPLADAVTLPACHLPPNVLVLPAFHGELLGNPAALRMVRSFLGYRPVHGAAGLRGTAEIMAAAAAAWRMPEPNAPSPPCHS